MIELTDITSSPRQTLRIKTEDNFVFQFLLQFSTVNQCWIWSLAYNNWAINGCRLTLLPDILHRYSYILPFGIMCMTEDPAKVDPFRLDDFVSGRVKLFVMTKEEAQNLNERAYGEQI